MDLREAEDIKNKWQEYTEELYKKDLHDPDNHNDMITHLGSDTTECAHTHMCAHTHKQKHTPPASLSMDGQGVLAQA